MNENCTLWTLMSPRFESVFFASFLCRFGQRNDVPPRTVANSAKKMSQLEQAAKAESSNPAKAESIAPAKAESITPAKAESITPTMTQNANARTWQPGKMPQTP
jgi:hypothetical protein